MYKSKRILGKHLKAHLPPDCPGFEHDGSADAHGVILIWGEQSLE